MSVQYTTKRRGLLLKISFSTSFCGQIHVLEQAVQAIRKSLQTCDQFVRQNSVCDGENLMSIPHGQTSQMGHIGFGKVNKVRENFPIYVIHETCECIATTSACSVDGKKRSTTENFPFLESHKWFANKNYVLEQTQDTRKSLRTYVRQNSVCDGENLMSILHGQISQMGHIGFGKVNKVRVNFPI